MTCKFFQTTLKCRIHTKNLIQTSSYTRRRASHQDFPQQAWKSHPAPPRPFVTFLSTVNIFHINKMSYNIKHWHNKSQLMSAFYCLHKTSHTSTFLFLWIFLVLHTIVFKGFKTSISFAFHLLCYNWVMSFAFMNSDILPLNSISTDICADELVVPGKQSVPTNGH